MEEQICYTSTPRALTNTCKSHNTNYTNHSECTPLPVPPLRRQPERPKRPAPDPPANHHSDHNTPTNEHSDHSISIDRSTNQHSDHNTSTNDTDSQNSSGIGGSDCIDILPEAKTEIVHTPDFHSPDLQTFDADCRIVPLLQLQNETTITNAEQVTEDEKHEGGHNDEGTDTDADSVNAKTNSHSNVERQSFGQPATVCHRTVVTSSHISCTEATVIRARAVNESVG